MDSPHTDARLRPETDAMPANPRRLPLLFAAFTLAAVFGCDDDHAGHEGPDQDPALTSFLSGETNVAPGGELELMIEVEGFELSGDEDHEHDEHGEHEGHAHDGEECPGGHVHIYLDDLMVNPVAMPASSTFLVTIPDDTPVGEHTLIARLHNRDHTIVEPQVTAEFDITVE